MKTIGLVGGMSWESTAEYYRIINELTAERRGGLCSAKVALYSVDFAEIELRQRAHNWEEAGDILADAARRVVNAGADFVLICTNTMHLVADRVGAAISVPLVHIVDTAAKRIVASGMTRVGVLGTKFTMEEGFYLDRLRSVHGIEGIVPDQPDRDEVNRIIFEELCCGRTVTESREYLVRLIHRLVAEGAQGVVLACTELPLLVRSSDTPTEVFDTTAIHAKAAVELALS